MKLDTESFKKWQEWARKIKGDLQTVIDDRSIFNQFDSVIKANLEHIEKNHGFYFCTFVRRCYVQKTASAIRRHMKVDKESISLMRLLQQIFECSDQFTYAIFLEMFPIDPSYVNWQESTFSHFSENGINISKAVIARDIEKMKQIGGNLEQFVDREIAHLDKRGYEGTFTGKEIDECISSFDELTCRYLTIITGDGFSTLEASVIFDWKDIFTVPIDGRFLRNQ